MVLGEIILSTEVFFSRPGQKCEIAERIKTDIKNSHHRILLANYYLTEPGIKEAIEESRAPIKRFVLNDKAINVDHVVLGDSGVLMHHKFLIADNILWVGSFNFSANATGFNWENVLRINDKETIETYYNEFKKMYLFGKAFTVVPWTKKYIKSLSRSILECNNCKKHVEDPFQHYIVEIDHVTKKNVYYADVNMEFLLDNSVKISQDIETYKLTCKDKENKKIMKCESCQTVFFEKDLNKVHFIDNEIEFKENGYNPVFDTQGQLLRVDTNYIKGGIFRKSKGYSFICSHCLYNLLDDYWTKL
jgi:hypothetical protein